MDEQGAEDELKLRQGARLYPVGQALRATYDAENHETLSSDVTGLMLDLTHVPYEPCAAAPPVAATVPATAPSLLGRMRTLLHL